MPYGGFVDNASIYYKKSLRKRAYKRPWQMQMTHVK